MSEPPQHHRCSWSRRRLTEIELSDGVLIGAGAGIGTLLFGLTESPSTWYSAELDPENAVFLHLVSEPIEGGIASASPLLPKKLAEQLGVSEVTLSRSLSTQLEIDLARGSTLVGKPSSAEHVIKLHDDCFFRFESQNPEGIAKVLSGILALHGRYIGQDGISAVAPDLLAFLRSQRAVRLKSVPALSRVNLLAKVQLGRFSRFRPWKPVGTIQKVDTTWQLVSVFDNAS